MNAQDILKYGHLTLVHTLDGVPQTEWEVSDVCGVWSVKDIVSHLTSFELALIEVLNLFLGGGSTALLEQWGEDPQAFNDNQVAARANRSSAEVLAEYHDAHTQVMDLIVQIDPEICREVGTMPWYGPEYALDDFLVYTFYGHKREHSAQVNVFRDLLINTGRLIPE